MKKLSLPNNRLDTLLDRYGITPNKVASSQWKKSSNLQRWNLAKARIKKTWALLSGRGTGRNGQQQILKAYDGQWKKKAFSRYRPEIGQGGAPWLWGDLKWVMSNEAGAAVRLLFLEEVLTQINPSSVLEVGAGNGINLLVLSARFPLTSFSGIEPTSGGVETAKLVIEDGELPDALVSFSPFPLLDVNAPARVRMEQGSAELLPYADASVDVVMTSLALEQMEEIRHQALSEIARVAKDWVVMLEPFRDVNQSGQRRVYVRTYDYFQGSIAELTTYGLQVEQVCLDMPHKAILGTALVVARRVR